MNSRIADARFSTYSGAPSLQPSLAPTLDSSNWVRSMSPRNTVSYLDIPIDEKYSTNFYGALGDASAAASTTTLPNTAADPKTADIRSWSKGFERMQDERLDKQRYVMSGNKSEEVSKLALGAKLERALGRRMTGQDASFTQKKHTRSKQDGSYEVAVR